LAQENPEIEMVKVDVDDADEVAGHCGIQAMPTFQFFKDGGKVEEMRGADQARLTQLIAKYK
jgi:thioredoxin 1